jgi:hypothetical protein
MERPRGFGRSEANTQGGVFLKFHVLAARNYRCVNGPCKPIETKRRSYVMRTEASVLS